MSKGLYDLTGLVQDELIDPKYKFKISDIIPDTQEFLEELPELNLLQFDPQMINRYFQLFEKDISGEFTFKKISILRKKRKLKLEEM
jgi:hypothetical protein